MHESVQMKNNIFTSNYVNMNYIDSLIMILSPPDQDLSLLVEYRCIDTYTSISFFFFFFHFEEIVQ